MFGPALQQFLDDLSSVSDRSPYEEALYQELSSLALIFGSSDASDSSIEPEYSEFLISVQHGQDVERVGAYRLGREAGYLHVDRIGSRGMLVSGVTIGAGAGAGTNDVKRLRCKNPDCENKRI